MSDTQGSDTVVFRHPQNGEAREAFWGSSTKSAAGSIVFRVFDGSLAGSPRFIALKRARARMTGRGLLGRAALDPTYAARHAAWESRIPISAP